MKPELLGKAVKNLEESFRKAIRATASKKKNHSRRMPEMPPEAMLTPKEIRETLRAGRKFSENPEKYTYSSIKL